MRLKSSLLSGAALVALCSLFVTFPLRGNGQDKPSYKSTGQEASLVGVIYFAGVPPERRRFDRSADPVCESVDSEALSEDVIITDGKLVNVFVYARSGNALDTFQFEIPSASVLLEHKGCRFVPHVLGIQSQQILRLVNSDPATENTHARPRLNPEWSQSQPPSVMAIERRFPRAEQYIQVNDDQHLWKKAYISVLPHPFFAVSGVDGTYKIEGLPPGQYTIVAWQEKYGEQSLDVSVGSKEQKMLDFTFTAPNH